MRAVAKGGHLVLAGLLSLAGGCGLALLVSSASGQGSGEPLFHDSGPIIFNFVPVKSTSEAKSVTISNAGGGVLEIVNIGVSAGKDFSIVTDGCTGMSLSAGQSCAVSVVFHPAAAGTRVGSLVISDSQGVCRDYVSMAGSGTETQAPATADVAACVSPGSTTTLPGNVVTAPGGTATIQTPTPPSNADTLQLVSPPRCISGRDISIRLRTSKADRIVMARVYINGHLVKVASSSSSLSVVVADLRAGKPLRRYRVQVISSTAAGPTLGLTRYFVACRQKSKHSAKSR